MVCERAQLNCVRFVSSRPGCVAQTELGVVFAVERRTNSQVGSVGACGFGRRDLSSLNAESIRRVVWKEIMYCTIVGFARKQHWDEVPLDVFAVGALAWMVMWTVKCVFGDNRRGPQLLRDGQVQPALG